MLGEIILLYYRKAPIKIKMDPSRTTLVMFRAFSTFRKFWRGKSLLYLWSSLSHKTITVQTARPGAGSARRSRAASAPAECRVGEGRPMSI